MAKSKRGDLGSYNHIKVDVVWHSVTLDDTELGGFVSDHQIHKSVDILNEHFAPANITFNLTSVNRCKNEGWYKGVGTNNTEAFQMREQTHVGDVKTLNIWTTQIMTNPDGTSAPGGYTAFFPWDKSTGWQHNGIVIRPDVLYGSNHKWFNDGKYLVHEAGHWCGLYHTFAGGCKDEDQVDDTPAQKDPSRVRDEQCVRRRSCPKAPNPDPISNFMDYANPKCPTRFTPGQIKRMREIMKHDRGFPL
ncbi:metalloprotease [Coprinopsis sp. MPI-PUGE-AT-0042]|nr:metalloprotease [Coprinopsis sp. MPI-PUGE-AT-0042]KAH6908376.1 metalloprotease [Coprinopsis sp. MPI-PUGE-AT-0042]